MLKANYMVIAMVDDSVERWGAVDVEVYGATGRVELKSAWRIGEDWQPMQVNRPLVIYSNVLLQSELIMVRRA